MMRLNACKNAFRIIGHTVTKVSSPTGPSSSLAFLLFLPLAPFLGFSDTSAIAEYTSSI